MPVMHAFDPPERFVVGTVGEPGARTFFLQAREGARVVSVALEKQQVVLGDGADVDVVALAEDPLEVAVQIFYVRGGRVRGQRGWVADRVEEGGTAELVEDFLLQLYAGAEADSIPREILVPALPPDVADAAQQLPHGLALDLTDALLVLEAGDDETLVHRGDGSDLEGDAVQGGALPAGRRVELVAGHVEDDPRRVRTHVSGGYWCGASNPWPSWSPPGCWRPT